MIVDKSVLRKVEPYDVAIVGAGAAGLALAYALCAGKLRVLVLEAGGVHETQNGRRDLAGVLAPGSVHPTLDLYRIRALGGTTRIWGGRCIPFDPIDFERRDWVAHSGWPISYASVAKYYQEALRVAEAGDDDFDPFTVLPGERAEMVAGLDDGSIATTLERFSRPTNMYARYYDWLKIFPGVHLLAHAVCTDVRLSTNGTVVEGLEIMTRDRDVHTVKANSYVLAGGGLETTRLLLNSNSLQSNGIGNKADQLGRHYMSHLCTTAARVSFDPRAGDVMSDYARDAEGIYVRRRLWITERAQRRFRVLNTTFRTHVPDPGNPSHGNAILSAMFLSKVLVQREYAAKFSEGAVPLGAYGRHALNIARQPVALSRFARMWLRQRVVARRKMPSVVIRSSENQYPLEFHAEQAPNPSSRVLLSDDRDRFGKRRLHVDWRLGGDDEESLLRCHRLLADRLTESRCGRLDYDPDYLVDRARRFGIVGGHHIGLTRMSASSTTGVVDENCRVHGVNNLYVASASTLPTSSQANPTLTLIALALRLGDHLRSLAAQDIKQVVRNGA